MASLPTASALAVSLRSLPSAKRAELDSLLLGGAVFRRAYRTDPAAFVADCIAWRPGEEPAPYQLEVLAELAIRRRAAVRGPHGLGKTSLAAWAVLWFALTRDDWKAPTTASAWRQLTHFLWPEIRKWARRLRWDKVGRAPLDTRAEMLALSLKLTTGEAFALASDDPSRLEGAHADSILYVFDEAKAIPADTWDAAEGALASGDAYALAISTPGEPAGRFYEIHAKRPGLGDWWTRAVTVDEAIAANRVSTSWVEARREQWGEASAVYQQRVLGEFAADGSDGIIPLAWVEAANARWQAWADADGDAPLAVLGVDVARSGTDKTVLAFRSGNVIAELRRYAQADTMETAGRVAGALDAYGGRAVIDVIGIGAGLVDRLREQGYNVAPFNASEGTPARDRSGEMGFINRRSAAWWGLRELLDPANPAPVALPPDDRLTGDLTAPRWRVTSSGRIQVESKDDIKKRLGRSTDDGDAVVMAFAGDGGSITTMAYRW